MVLCEKCSWLLRGNLCCSHFDTPFPFITWPPHSRLRLLATKHLSLPHQFECCKYEELSFGWIHFSSPPLFNARKSLTTPFLSEPRTYDVWRCEDGNECASGCCEWKPTREMAPILHQTLTTLTSRAICCPPRFLPTVLPPRALCCRCHSSASHDLDTNSLQALHHDDDEDQVHRAHSFFQKQKGREEGAKSTNVKPDELCSVCGDLAFGIHFSVLSCNGCKTFFRRVVIENRTYSCKRNGNCRIDKNCRCSCRACRFKKCISVGMDATELNIERRRKRRVVESVEKPSMSIDQIDDPLILSTSIEWAKSFGEVERMDDSDKEAMVVNSAFSILVFSEAFHTPERFTDRIMFPDGLSGFRNFSANIIKERSGLIPTVVAVINNILVPIRRMQMTEIEYVLLLAIVLFDSECLSLSKSAVSIINEKRTALLASLRRHLNRKLRDRMEAAVRMAELLLRISNVHKVAAFKRETLCTIETFNLMSPHPLTMEISKKYADVSFF
ncbi:hypothetical protein niasHT_039689 [Heterodera trifolii]|uniref:Uncharacterized protein n=1 Tax=Heterodera trifolii TaxID=157864 RepID=A0ABD2I933_9BILA